MHLILLCLWLLPLCVQALVENFPHLILLSHLPFFCLPPWPSSFFHSTHPPRQITTSTTSNTRKTCKLLSPAQPLSWIPEPQACATVNRISSPGCPSCASHPTNPPRIHHLPLHTAPFSVLAVLTSGTSVPPLTQARALGVIHPETHHPLPASPLLLRSPHLDQSVQTLKSTLGFNSFFTQLLFSAPPSSHPNHSLQHAQSDPSKRTTYLGFPGGAVVENLPADAGDTGSSPGLGRSHMPRSN